MKANTMEEIIKTLPDPLTHLADECYFYGRYLDKEQDKHIESRMRFKKDASGTKWVYVDNQHKVADS